ncbi:MAG: hypothetical protein LBM27_02775 [Lactobacillaceae bacterium]|jgi:amidase|nr:hypothetical protein [Lactobacillaceae bacterium]
MYEIENKSLAQISEDLKNKVVTATELVEIYFKQIEFYSSYPNNLNAVISLNSEARNQAQQIDGDFSNGIIKSPLQGLPILVKDNIDVAGLPTTAGVLALKDFKVSQDAEIIRQFKEAGVIILGKTNLSEFAHFKSDNEPSGFSVVGGQTKNPTFPDWTTSGSSSGSAVAAVVNLASFTIGTETNGSILSPAHMNQVFGLKPTLNKWSQVGILPLAHSQDVAGPMTRTAEDLAFIWSSLYSSETAETAITKATYFDFSDNNPIASYLYKTTTESATIDYEKFVPSTEFNDDDELTVILYEFKHDLDDYFKMHGSELSLEKIVDFNNQDRDQRAPFGQELLEQALATGGDLSHPRYANALTSVKDYSTSVLIAALKDVQVTVSFDAQVIGLAAMAGYPSISIPMGILGDYVTGGPTSIFATAKPDDEISLIQFAQQIKGEHK